MEYRDYYNILGIDKNADEATIKSAYRKLAKKYHPDLNSGDEKAQEKFKEVNEAYEVLSDPEKKKQYDTFGSNYNFSDGYNFDPTQYGYTYTSGGNSSDFSDFFDMFFGGSGKNGGFNININDLLGRNKSKKKRRATYDSEVALTIDEAYSGTTRDMNLSINGSVHTIPVKIPAGITPGKKIKVKADKYGIDGDILFKVNVLDSPDEKLSGLNIIKTKEIYPWQAALGDKVNITTPEGKIKVSVPKGIKGSSKLRIPNKGFVDLKGNKGDLYIQFNIVNPEHLNEEQIELYRKLSETVR